MKTDGAHRRLSPVGCVKAMWRYATRRASKQLESIVCSGSRVTDSTIMKLRGSPGRDYCKTYTKSICSHIYIYALCIRFTIIPPLLTDPQQFHYCIDSNPGTGADDAFVLKRGVWRNATWPSHSRPAIAASAARHFQICYSPLTF